MEFTVQLTDQQFQWKEKTVTHFNVKNPLSINMIKSLVCKFKTHGTVTDHPQSGLWERGLHRSAPPLVSFFMRLLDY